MVSGVAVLDPATLAAIQAVAQAASQAAPPVQYVTVAAYPEAAPQVIPVAPLPAASAEPDGKRGKRKKKHGKG